MKAGGVGGGEVGVLFRFEVVNGDALKIGNNEVAGAIFALPGFLQSRM